MQFPVAIVITNRSTEHDSTYQCITHLSRMNKVYQVLQMTVKYCNINLHPKLCIEIIVRTEVEEVS